MKTLVVGGTGLVGSRAAEGLRARGHEVTLMTRGEAAPLDPPWIEGLPRIRGDYAEGVDPRMLEPFEGIVFAAGQDIRHVAAEEEDEAFWTRAQSAGVPGFAAAAKRAGVSRFVQIGSYYHQLHPEWVEGNPYVAARKAADERSRALSDAGFAAMTLNPPSILGVIPRSLRFFGRFAAWLGGDDAFAPPGGTNYMSVRSLAEAVVGALERGEGGRAYLIGDANLSFREYFQLLADAAGLDRTVPERDEECPFQPDRFIVQGRGRVISYEPDPAETALLGYRRDDVPAAVTGIVGSLSLR